MQNSVCLGQELREKYGESNG